MVLDHHSRSRLSPTAYTNILASLASKFSVDEISYGIDLHRAMPRRKELYIVALMSGSRYWLAEGRSQEIVNLKAFLATPAPLEFSFQKSDHG